MATTEEQYRRMVMQQQMAAQMAQLGAPNPMNAGAPNPMPGGGMGQGMGQGMLRPGASAQGPMRPPPELSGKQILAQQKIEDAPYAGMSDLSDVYTGTGGGALAKTIAAHFLKKKGQKKQGGQLKVLKKQQEADENKRLTAEATKSAQYEMERTRQEELDKVNKKRSDANIEIQRERAGYERERIEIERKKMEAANALLGQAIELYDADGNSTWVRLNKQNEYVDMEGNPIDVAALGLTARKPTRATGTKPSASEMKSYRGGLNLMEQIDTLDTSYGKMTSEEKEMLDAPGTEVLLGMASAVLPEGTGRMIEEEIAFPDREVRSYRTKSAKFESDYSKLMAGLNVTGFEMEDRKKWSPYAQGISQTERQQRYDNLKQELIGEKSIFEELYGKEYTDMKAKRTGTVYEHEGKVYYELNDGTYEVEDQ